MTKSELVLRLSRKFPDMFQRDVEKVVDILLREMRATLTRGGRIELRGFGAFSVRKREARIGRNPKTGREVSVGERHLFPHRQGTAGEVKPFYTRKVSGIPATFFV